MNDLFSLILSWDSLSMALDVWRDSHHLHGHLAPRLSWLHHEVKGRIKGLSWLA